MLVLIEKAGNVLLRSKISNICSDPESQSCDREFVADVFEFHLAPKGEHGSGLFEKYSTVYISGDHGPHFSSKHTIYNESRMMRRFQKRFYIVSLCSYHAYNACDAAGAESKTLARSLAKSGEDILNAEDYSFAIRNSSYSNSWSYAFPVINRDQEFWKTVDGDDLQTPKGLILAKQCEIMYVAPNSPQGAHDIDCKCCEPGIIYCRTVPGQGQFKVYNLFKNSRMYILLDRTLHNSLEMTPIDPIVHYQSIAAKEFLTQ